MNSLKDQKQDGTIGIPFQVEIHPTYCSATVDAISILLKHVYQTQRALNLMGAQLGDARSIRDGAQVFTLTSTSDQGWATGPKESLKEVVQRKLTLARTLSTTNIRDTRGNEPQPPSSAGEIAGTEGSVINKIRDRLVCGPVQILLNGTVTPWSENLARPEHNPPPPGARFVVVREVGRTTHLITEDKRRYHPHDSSEAAAVEPGSTVMVENCTTESMLFADTSALSVQGELELSSENDSDR